MKPKGTLQTPFGNASAKHRREIRGTELWWDRVVDRDGRTRYLLGMKRKITARVPDWLPGLLRASEGVYRWVDVHDDNFVGVAIVFPEAFEPSSVYYQVSRVLEAAGGRKGGARIGILQSVKEVAAWLRTPAGAPALAIARDYLHRYGGTYSVGRNGLTEWANGGFCRQVSQRADGAYCLTLERKGKPLPYQERMTIEEILLSGWTVTKIEKQNGVARFFEPR